MNESLKKNTLRGEFEKFWHNKLEYGKTNPDHQKVSDFWFSRIESLLDQKKREIEAMDVPLIISGKPFIDRDAALAILSA